MNSADIPAFTHGGNIYAEKSPCGSWLDYSANINPLGLPESVKKSILEHIDGLVHYPDPEGRDLKRAISACYGVEENQVILGNGAAELFYVYFHTKRPKRVLLPVPSFSEYEKAARCCGAEIQYFYLQEAENFQLDIEGLGKALGDCGTLILGNPNNPTGQLISKDDLVKLVEKAADCNVDIIVDESFLDFRQDRAKYSLVQLAGQYGNLLVISSLTKMFAIPGLRLGYGVCSRDIVRLLEYHKDTWNVNMLAQAAGVAALADEEYAKKTRLHTKQTVAEMELLLQNISGVKVYPPTVNFVLLKLEQSCINSKDLQAKMKQNGVLIRDCSNYPGLDGRYIRLAIRDSQTNKDVAAILNMCLND